MNDGGRYEHFKTKAAVCKKKKKCAACVSLVSTHAVAALLNYTHRRLDMGLGNKTIMIFIKNIAVYRNKYHYRHVFLLCL